MNRLTIALLALALVTAMTAFTGCAGGSEDVGAGTYRGSVGGPAATSSAPPADAGGSGGRYYAPSGSAWANDVAPTEAAEPGGDRCYAPSGMAHVSGGNGASERPTEPPPGTVSGENRLTAFDRDDNLMFEEYCRYYANWYSDGYEYGNALLLDPSQRQEIRVTDFAGLYVPGATVTVTHQESGFEVTHRTMADGRTQVFLPEGVQGEFTVTASYPEVGEASVTVAPDKTAPWEVPIEGLVPGADRVSLDLCFIVDCTGSMGEELGAIQANLDAIAQRVYALESAPVVRFGLVVFRDRGETYRARSTDFTTQLDAFRGTLAQQSAVRGGDKPEDVERALNAACRLSWSEGPNAVRLAVLVGDAPPHVQYEDQVPDYLASSLRLLAEGVKVFPLAAEGLQESVNGEFIFRQIGQITRGRFIGLSYTRDAGASGYSAGGDAQVSQLDALIVDLIQGELYSLTNRGRDDNAAGN